MRMVKPRIPSIGTRSVAAATCLAFVYVHVLYGALQPASEFWRERKAAVSERASPPDPRPPEASPPILAQLPSPNLDAFQPSFPKIQAAPFSDSSFPDRPDFKLPGAPLPRWFRDIPADAAALKELYLPPGWKPGDLVVVHVQDAHDNLEAQRNISRIIASLQAKTVGAPLLVGLEGARGPFNFSPYRSFPNKALTAAIADHFLKGAYISGAEYAGLTAESLPVFWGLEDEKLYAEHVRAFKEAAREGAEAEPAAKSLAGAIERLKARFFNPALRDLDQRIARYRRGESGLGDYLKSLAGSDPGGAGENVRLFLRALALEKNLDNARIDREKNALAAELAKSFSQRELEDLARLNLDYRAGRINAETFYRFLQDRCERHGLGLTRSPALKAYIGYAALCERIRPDRFQSEIEALERSRLRGLIKTEREARIQELSQDLFLVRKLFRFSLSPREWETYRSRSAQIGRMEKRIRELDPALSFDAGPERLRGLLERFGRFDEAALARNDALVGNLLKKAAATAAEKAELPQIGAKPVRSLRVNRLDESGPGARHWTLKIDLIGDLGKTTVKAVVCRKGESPALPGDAPAEEADLLAYHVRLYPYRSGWAGRIFGFFQRPSPPDSRPASFPIATSLPATAGPFRTDRAVLVAGGFHTDGIARLLKSKKIAYAVFTPRLGRVEGEGNRYLDVFLRDETPLEKLFTGERITLKVPLGLAQTPLDGDGAGARAQALVAGDFVALEAAVAGAEGAPVERETEAAFGREPSQTFQKPPGFLSLLRDRLWGWLSDQIGRMTSRLTGALVFDIPQENTLNRFFLDRKRDLSAHFTLQGFPILDREERLLGWEQIFRIALPKKGGNSALELHLRMSGNRRPVIHGIGSEVPGGAQTGVHSQVTLPGCSELEIDALALGDMRDVRNLSRAPGDPNAKDEMLSGRGRAIFPRVEARPGKDGGTELFITVETPNGTHEARIALPQGTVVKQGLHDLDVPVQGGEKVRFEGIPLITLRAPAGRDLSFRVSLTTDHPVRRVFSPAEIFKPGVLWRYRWLNIARYFSGGARQEFGAMRKYLLLSGILISDDALYAGSWQFLTFFGRDTILFSRTMMDVLRPEIIEAALQSVLKRVSPEGRVPHEESYSEPEGSEKRLDYNMVDGDLMLATLAGEYLARYPERAEKFLTPERCDALARNFALVLGKAEKFHRSPSAENLVRALSVTFQWRDSVNGMLRGAYGYDVNVVWMPAALRDIRGIVKQFPQMREALRARGIDSAREPWDAMMEAWRGAKDFFKTEISLEEYRGRLKTYYGWLAAHDPAKASRLLAMRWDGVTARRFIEDGILPASLMAILGPGGTFSFPVLSLDMDGKKIEVPHNDVAFLLFSQILTPEQLREAMAPVFVPYAFGGLLVDGVGIVTANPMLLDYDPARAYSDQYRIFLTPAEEGKSPERLRRELVPYAMLNGQAYHGSIVWSFLSAIFELGLLRQIQRGASGLAHTYFDMFRRAYRRAGSMLNEEMWAFTIDDAGQYQPAYMSQGEDVEQASNPAQLWSLNWIGVWSAERAYRRANLVHPSRNRYIFWIDPNAVVEAVYENGERRLHVQSFHSGGKTFLRAGSRTYQVPPGVSRIVLNDLLRDPLLWLGNAELVGFFGKDAVLDAQSGRGPAAPLLIVEPEAHRENAARLDSFPPLPYVWAEEARRELANPDLDPLLAQHERLVLYFEALDVQRSDPLRAYDVSLDVLEAAAEVGERAANRLVYGILGMKDVAISNIVSGEFAKLIALMRHVGRIYDHVTGIARLPVYELSPIEQNLALHRLLKILGAIQWEEIDRFEDLREINDRVRQIVRDQLGWKGADLRLFDFAEDQDSKRRTLVIDLGELAKDYRASQRHPEDRDRRVLAFAPNGKDMAVVDALTNLAESARSRTVDRILRRIGRWRQKWVAAEVLKALSRNTRIRLKSPADRFLSRLVLGVSRGGFGLGGASIETELWIKNIFSRFIGKGRIRIAVGRDKRGRPDIREQVDFGPSVGGIAAEPDVDAYQHRELAGRLFGEGPLPADELQRLEKDYRDAVNRTAGVLERWILSNDIRVVLLGQAAFPYENPILYPALLEALRRVNHRAIPGNRVIGLIRQNYFGEKRPVRPGVEKFLALPQQDDPVEIFVESETNAYLFEQYFGFRPSILYETVPFAEADLRPEQTLALREQIRRQPEIAAAAERFKAALAASADHEGKERVDLDRDIVILQPSRLNANKRAESTLRLAKMLQALENQHNPHPRKVRVVFLGAMDPRAIVENAGLNGGEREALDRILAAARSDGSGGPDISGQVYFLGALPHAQAMAAMTYADIVSQPSDQESFGRTPLEAISAGVPIIYIREWIYPLAANGSQPERPADSEDLQVAQLLFRGLNLFFLRPGRLERGEDGPHWMPGEDAPDRLGPNAVPWLVESIWELLSRSKAAAPGTLTEMEKIARSNFALARKYFDDRDTERFMRLRFLSALRRQGLKFEDREPEKETAQLLTGRGFAATSAGHVAAIVLLESVLAFLMHLPPAATLIALGLSFAFEAALVVFFSLEHQFAQRKGAGRGREGLLPILRGDLLMRDGRPPDGLFQVSDHGIVANKRILRRFPGFAQIILIASMHRYFESRDAVGVYLRMLFISLITPFFIASGIVVIWMLSLTPLMQGLGVPAHYDVLGLVASALLMLQVIPVMIFLRADYRLLDKTYRDLDDLARRVLELRRREPANEKERAESDRAVAEAIIEWGNRTGHSVDLFLANAFPGREPLGVKSREQWRALSGADEEGRHAFRDWAPQGSDRLRAKELMETPIGDEETHLLNSAKFHRIVDYNFRANNYRFGWVGAVVASLVRRNSRYAQLRARVDSGEELTPEESEESRLASPSHRLEIVYKVLQRHVWPRVRSSVGGGKGMVGIALGRQDVIGLRAASFDAPFLRQLVVRFENGGIEAEPEFREAVLTALHEDPEAVFVLFDHVINTGRSVITVLDVLFSVLKEHKLQELGEEGAEHWALDHLKVVAFAVDPKGVANILGHRLVDLFAVGYAKAVLVPDGRGAGGSVPGLKVANEMEDGAFAEDARTLVGQDIRIGKHAYRVLGLLGLTTVSAVRLKSDGSGGESPDPRQLYILRLAVGKAEIDSNRRIQEYAAGRGLLHFFLGRFIIARHFILPLEDNGNAYDDRGIMVRPDLPSLQNPRQYIAGRPGAIARWRAFVSLTIQYAVILWAMITMNLFSEVPESSLGVNLETGRLMVYSQAGVNLAPPVSSEIFLEAGRIVPHWWRTARDGKAEAREAFRVIAKKISLPTLQELDAALAGQGGLPEDADRAAPNGDARAEAYRLFYTEIMRGPVLYEIQGWYGERGTPADFDQIRNALLDAIDRDPVEAIRIMRRLALLARRNLRQGPGEGGENGGGSLFPRLPPLEERLALPHLNADQAFLDASYLKRANLAQLFDLTPDEQGRIPEDTLAQMVRSARQAQAAPILFGGVALGRAIDLPSLKAQIAECCRLRGMEAPETDEILAVLFERGWLGALDAEAGKDRIALSEVEGWIRQKLKTARRKGVRLQLLTGRWDRFNDDQGKRRLEILIIGTLAAVPLEVLRGPLEGAYRAGRVLSEQQ